MNTVPALKELSTRNGHMSNKSGRWKKGCAQVECGGTEERMATSVVLGWRGNSLGIFPEDVTRTMSLKDIGPYGRGTRRRASLEREHRVQRKGAWKNEGGGSVSVCLRVCVCVCVYVCVSLNSTYSATVGTKGQNPRAGRQGKKGGNREWQVSSSKKCGLYYYTHAYYDTIIYH